MYSKVSFVGCICERNSADAPSLFQYLDFPDAPVVAPETPYQPAGQFFTNGPRLGEFLREMRRETFAKYEYVRSIPSSKASPR